MWGALPPWSPAGLPGVVELPGHGQDLPGPPADEQLGQPGAQPLCAVQVGAPDPGRRHAHALHLLIHPLLHPLGTLQNERSSGHAEASLQIHRLRGGTGGGGVNHFGQRHR